MSSGLSISNPSAKPSTQGPCVRFNADDSISIIIPDQGLSQPGGLWKKQYRSHDSITEFVHRESDIAVQDVSIALEAATDKPLASLMRVLPSVSSLEVGGVRLRNSGLNGITRQSHFLDAARSKPADWSIGRFSQIDPGPPPEILTAFAETFWPHACEVFTNASAVRALATKRPYTKPSDQVSAVRALLVEDEATKAAQMRQYLLNLLGPSSHPAFVQSDMFSRARPNALFGAEFRQLNNFGLAPSMLSTGTLNSRTGSPVLTPSEGPASDIFYLSQHGCPQPQCNRDADVLQQIRRIISTDTPVKDFGTVRHARIFGMSGGTTAYNKTDVEALASLAERCHDDVQFELDHPAWSGDGDAPTVSVSGSAALTAASGGISLLTAMGRTVWPAPRTAASMPGSTTAPCIDMTD